MLSIKQNFLVHKPNNGNLNSDNKNLNDLINDKSKFSETKQQNLTSEKTPTRKTVVYD